MSGWVPRSSLSSWRHLLASSLQGLLPVNFQRPLRVPVQWHQLHSWAMGTGGPWTCTGTFHLRAPPPRVKSTLHLTFLQFSCAWDEGTESRVYHPFTPFYVIVTIAYSAAGTHFLSSFSLADVPEETFLVFFLSSYSLQIQIQVAFDFPNLIYASYGSLWVCWYLVHFFFMFEFSQSLLIHADPLSPLFCILLFGMDHGWVQRR